MALPVLNSYKKSVTSPVSNRLFEIRPYLVGEEKALMISAESEDPNEIRDAIFNLISACVTGGITKKISSFDLEFLFLEIRKLSADQITRIVLIHEKCEGRNEVDVDLTNIVASDIPEKVIMLDKEKQIGLKMKHPFMDDLLEIDKSNVSNVEKGFIVMAKSIECVFQGDEIFNEFTQEELLGWLDGLNDAQLGKISSYVNNMPSLKMDVEYQCTGCGETVKQEIRGIQNFLA